MGRRGSGWRTEGVEGRVVACERPFPSVGPRGSWCESTVRTCDVRSTCSHAPQNMCLSSAMHGRRRLRQTPAPSAAAPPPPRLFFLSCPPRDVELSQLYDCIPFSSRNLLSSRDRDSVSCRTKRRADGTRAAQQQQQQQGGRRALVLLHPMAFRCSQPPSSIPISFPGLLERLFPLEHPDVFYWRSHRERLAPTYLEKTPFAFLSSQVFSDWFFCLQCS